MQWKMAHSSVFCFGIGTSKENEISAKDPEGSGKYGMKRRCSCAFWQF